MNNKHLVAAAATLLLPAAMQANEILEQVNIYYTDRVQHLAPTPDHYLFFTLLPTLQTWLMQGAITAYAEIQCVSPCAAGTEYYAVPVTPGAASPEPATVWLTAMVVIVAAVWALAKRRKA